MALYDHPAPDVRPSDQPSPGLAEHLASLHVRIVELEDQLDAAQAAPAVPVAAQPQEAGQAQPELDCIEWDTSGKLVGADVIVKGERVKLVREAAPAVPDGWNAAAEWLRNNYQDYPTIDALTVAMIAAAAEIGKQK